MMEDGDERDKHTSAFHMSTGPVRPGTLLRGRQAAGLGIRANNSSGTVPTGERFMYSPAGI